MSELLIGLAGPARSGKDTVAQLLVRERHLIQLAFAGPIRRAVAAMLHMTGAELEQLEARHQERPLDWLGGVSLRQIYQTLGTEWGRTLRSDWWLRMADRDMRVAREAPLVLRNRPVVGFVFSDVRFDNEAHFIRERGGRVWHIRRDDAPAVRAHLSETGVCWQSGDQVLENDGTVEQLLERARWMLGEVAPA